MKNKYLVIPMLIASMISFPIRGEINANDTLKIQTKEQAYSTALELTGFNKFKNTQFNLALSEQNVSLVKFTDSTTPFISNEINNKNSWNIKFDTIYFETNGKKFNYFSFSTDIFLDEQSGKLLSIICKSGKVNNRKIYRLPTVEESELQLQHFGEKYHGLPDTPPKISLKEALEKCSGYLSAREIIVSYVLYSIKTSDTVPVWVIYLRGYNPISNKGKEYQTTNYRYIIDATTGEMIFNNNLPYPLLEGGFGIEKNIE